MAGSVRMEDNREEDCCNGCLFTRDNRCCRDSIFIIAIVVVCVVGVGAGIVILVGLFIRAG